MDGTGSEASKRQRLDFHNASHRPQQQPPIARSHTLPPPNSYPPQPPPPPSPYHQSVSHEHRSLPEPTPHGYSQFTSGHNTPIRDQRSFPVDTSYSRRGSASGSTRSPDEYNHFAAPRTLSTAPPSDGQSYQPQHPLDHHGQFSAYQAHDGPLNGAGHHGLPMSAYSEHNHAVPGHPGDYLQSPTNMVHTPYGPPHLAEPASQQNMQRPRKGTRAQQACDTCRGRKAKCDEGRPMCGFCKENNHTCKYQTVAPAKADRANQIILDHLNGLGSQLAQMEAMIRVIAREMSGLSGNSAQLALIACPPRRSPSAERRRMSLHDHPAVGESPSGSLETNGTNPGDRDDGDARDTPAVAGPAEPSAVEHITAAHRLLGWPSIRAAFSKPNSQILSDDYVMKLEERKGVLRVYGRGEGQDAGDGGHPSPTGSIASPRSDEGSDVRSPPSSEGLWGSAYADPPTARSVGGLGRDGKLEVDGHTLEKLLRLYLENIHILHPFLDKNTLTKMVKRFSMDYSPGTQMKWARLDGSTVAVPTAFEGLREPASHLPKSSKRKHSETQYSGGGPELVSPTTRSASSPPFQRAISTAIVLLVMALGKICEWRDALPGPVSDDGKENRTMRPFPFSPLASNSESSSPLSIRQSPSSSAPAVSNASAMPTPSGLPLRDPGFKSSSEDGSPNLRNVDVIPGLAYYAYATDILGNCHGGNDLSHVQANLLAALYAGQLARAFESWSWIHSACRACRYLVRDLRSLQKEPEPRQDLIKFAFWTCLQLESDILAELDLPQSGIQSVHGMSYPKGFVEQAHFMQSDTPVTKMMMCYSGQIHLRGILNHIQSNLHRPGSAERPNAALRDHLNDMLEQWRSVLPEQLRWDDAEDPAEDINDARLRAKFYGAQYIIHRPFLRLTLDREVPIEDAKSPRNSTFTPLDERRTEPMAPPGADLGLDVPADILRSARICVGAAMQSTIAFDKIIRDRRLVVTNIFGTAHAQFGNMLVLAATYKSKSLHKLVPRDKLERLFDRTIKFLHSLGPISSTLETDSQILALLREDVLKREAMHGREGTSFSSNGY